MALVVGMTVISAVLLALMPNPSERSGVISLSVLDLQDEFAVAAEEKPWRKIIVHSSLGTRGGMAELNAAWNKYYRSQGLPDNRGAGYHFVINDSHRDGYGDGATEMAPRWRKQAYGDFLDGEQAGLHLRDSIGICVMGDPDNAPFSVKQVDALVELVQVLQDRYDIPRENVEFRVSQGGQGAAPFFPEAEVRRRIRD